MSAEEWVKLILGSNVVAAVIVGLFGLLTLKIWHSKIRLRKVVGTESGFICRSDRGDAQSLQFLKGLS